MKIIGILQARDGSTRLPKKATTDINGKVLIHHVWDRLKAAERLDEVIVSTSINSPEIIGWCKTYDIPYHAGPEDDLLTRHIGAAEKCKADAIMWITADCLWHDPFLLDTMILVWKEGILSKMDAGALWVSNRVGRRDISEGLDAEIYLTSLLKTLAADPDCPRESFSLYLAENWKKYPCWRQGGSGKGRHLHLSIDTPEDLTLARKMMEIVGNDDYRYDRTLEAYAEVTA